MTPYARALVQARAHTDFLDLANGQMHPYGYRHDAAFFTGLWDRYLTNRSYAPQALGPLSTREALARWYRQRGLPAQAHQIFLTSGTSEAYRLLFTLLCPINRTLALPLPGYPLFEELAALAERPVEYYHLDAAHNWAITQEGLHRLSADAELLVLIEPNNPTGRILTDSEVQILRAVAEDRGSILIIDEVFEGFDYKDPRRPPRALSFPNNLVITLNGLSKRWACPDFKLAWGVLSGPPQLQESLLKRLDTALDALLPVSPFSCLLAQHLLEDPEQLAQRMRADLAANRKTLLDFQQHHPGLLVAALPDGGIHWMPRTPLADDETLSITLLRQWHLHVMPGYLFGVEDQGFVSMSLLLPPPLFQEGMSRLGSALSDLTAS